jgi:hypothetical protein
MSAYGSVICSNCGKQNYICLENDDVPVSFEFTCFNCNTEQKKNNIILAFDIDEPIYNEIVQAKIIN